MSTDLKKKAVEERIKHLEDALAKAYKYLEDGSHASYSGFLPIFGQKVRNGKVVPPHKDWIRNVFIPSREKAIRKAEKILDRFE